MKTKKRFLVVGGILLGVVLVGAAFVEAWGQGLPFFPRGPQGSFHPGPGFRREMGEFMLYRLDEKVNQLDLTVDQKSKYDEFHGAIKTELSQAEENHDAMREALRKEMAKEIPDVSAITEKIKSTMQGGFASAQKDLDLFSTFYQSLNDNQKKQLVSEIKRRMAHDAGRWPGMGR